MAEVLDDEEALPTGEERREMRLVVETNV